MIAAGFFRGEAEELRRAFGFKRSERRMAEIENEASARHDGEMESWAILRMKSFSRSLRSRCTDFRNRTRQASR
jgi:hypothetical protein